MSPETTVNRMIDAVNRHDPEGVAACYAEDAVMHNPLSPDEPLVGREAIIAFETVIASAFSDFRWEPIEPVIVSGNRAIYQVIATGTFDGPMPQPDGSTLEPNGKTFSIEVAGVDTIGDDGLIAEERPFMDATGFAMALGLVG